MLFKNKYKKQRDFLESILESSTNELQFKNTQEDELLKAIYEIEDTTTDPIAKKLCKIATERNSINKMLHTRKLFPDI